jgi:V-containing nitrogenase delta subunit
VTLQTKELVDYIQERCLWQFASRAHDREENIQGVLSLLGELLTGGSPKPETPMERCHFANANHLAREIRSVFPWLSKLPKDDLSTVVAGTIERLQEITISQSKNGELHIPAY